MAAPFRISLYRLTKCKPERADSRVAVLTGKTAVGAEKPGIFGRCPVSWESGLPVSIPIGLAEAIDRN